MFKRSVSASPPNGWEDEMIREFFDRRSLTLLVYRARIEGQLSHLNPAHLCETVSFDAVLAESLRSPLQHVRLHMEFMENWSWYWTNPMPQHAEGWLRLHEEPQLNDRPLLASVSVILAGASAHEKHLLECLSRAHQFGQDAVVLSMKFTGIPDELGTTADSALAYCTDHAVGVKDVRWWQVLDARVNGFIED